MTARALSKKRGGWTAGDGDKGEGNAKYPAHGGRRKREEGGNGDRPIERKRDREEEKRLAWGPFQGPHIV